MARKRHPKKDRINYDGARTKEEALEELRALAERTISRLYPREELDKIRAGVIAYTVKSVNQRVDEAIAAGYDIESLPLPALEFCLAATRVLRPRGYVLEINEEQLEEDPQYRRVSVIAVRRNDIGFYPVIATFTYSADDEQLATRNDLADLLGYVDMDGPAYGMEIVVSDLNPDGMPVIDELRNRGIGKNLQERHSVSRGWEDYGLDATVFYLPQTEEEIEYEKKQQGPRSYFF